MYWFFPFRSLASGYSSFIFMWSIELFVSHIPFYVNFSILLHIWYRIFNFVNKFEHDKNQWFVLFILHCKFPFELNFLRGPGAGGTFFLIIALILGGYKFLRGWGLEVALIFRSSFNFWISLTMMKKKPALFSQEFNLCS